MKKYFLLLTSLMILGGCQNNPLNNDQSLTTKPVINNTNSEKVEPQKVSVTVADEEETVDLSEKELAEIKAADKDVAIENDAKVLPEKNKSVEKAVEIPKNENAYPGYPLRYNVKTADNNVKKIQNRLNAIGYNLEVDGYFGQKTMDAVKFIQEQNGLEVDGIVGPLTWDALFNNTLTVEEGGMGDE